MALRTKVLGTAALLGSASYVSYRSRNPTLLDSPRLPTRPVTPDMTAYDRKEDPMYLIAETPSDLQRHIASLRKQATRVLHQGDAFMRSAVDHVVMGEQKVERTIKGLAPRHETVLPGAIYVAISGLTGSIIARNRSLPIRFLTPLLLFVVSARAFIPETSANVGNLIYSWESKVPELKKWHDFTTSHIALGLWKAGEVVEDAEHMIDGAVQGSREVFEKNSGIKLPK